MGSVDYQCDALSYSQNILLCSLVILDVLVELVELRASNIGALVVQECAKGVIGEDDAILG